MTWCYTATTKCSLNFSSSVFMYQWWTDKVIVGHSDKILLLLTFIFSASKCHIWLLIIYKESCRIFLSSMEYIQEHFDLYNSILYDNYGNVIHALRHVYTLDLGLQGLFFGSSEHHLENKKLGTWHFNYLLFLNFLFLYCPTMSLMLLHFVQLGPVGKMGLY